MNPNCQFPFGVDEPSRLIREVEVYRAPISGRVIEIVTVIETIYDQGKFITDKRKEDAILDDGRSVGSTEPIRECSRCLSVIHADNSFACSTCGRTFCKTCRISAGSEKQLKQYCPDCIKESNTLPAVRAVKRHIWGQL